MIMPKKELKSENSAGTALQEMESLSPGGDSPPGERDLSLIHI